MPMKNPLTPAGIEPATFQFVAQHHSHCATAVPHSSTLTCILAKEDTSRTVFSRVQDARFQISERGASHTFYAV